MCEPRRWFQNASSQQPPGQVGNSLMKSKRSNGQKVNKQLTGVIVAATAATATATREMRMVVLVQESTWSLGKNDTNFPIQKSSFVKSRNNFGLKTSWSKTKILNPNGPKGPSPK